ncbi:MAG: ureidoglycolate lyase [Gammaproteobacteria bacterium]|nr:ureidoglycolate lyase [Gammaproteobacteria bacterium]
MTITLRPEPLTKERFALYGDVIESSRSSDAMNDARFERFDDLCGVDIREQGHVAVSIAKCRAATSLPLMLDMVERHPLGSQAFVPLSPCKMVVVVAPPQESVDTAELRAFVTNGRQGINYKCGTWHMPLIAFESGQEFLIIDRGGNEANCDIHMLGDAVLLESD